MNINTNVWNRLRYTLYTPFYDGVIRALDDSRQRAIELLALRAGERLLVVGAGTGEDLRYIPQGVEITAIDITPTMIEQVQRKAALLSLTVHAQVMDEQFDAIVLNLIVAVIPDPIACVRESARVLKADGRIVVFDKFLGDNRKPSLGRQLLNFFARIIATNLNRQLLPIVERASLCITHEELARKYAKLGFKIALLKKCAQQ